MADYRIQVRDKSGNALAEFDKAKNLIFDVKLNGVGMAQFSMPYTDTKLIDFSSMRSNEIFIYRGDTVIWAGELAHRKGTLEADSANLVTLTAYDWLELFNYRYTSANKSYASTDAGQIAWDLIDTTQNKTDGDYGVTQGTIETTKDRDRTYSTKNIMEALIQLSEVDGGFDFEFTTDKVFNVFSRKGSDLSASVVFEWGTNIHRVAIEEDFKTPANEAIVLGSGFGSSQKRETVTDTAARGVHNLRQDRISFTDVSESTTLTDKGQAHVNQYKQPVIRLDMEQKPATIPTIGTLKTGDQVRVVINDGVYTIDNKYRIYGYEISVNDDNREGITYFVSIQ